MVTPFAQVGDHLEARVRRSIPALAGCSGPVARGDNPDFSLRSVIYTRLLSLVET